MNINELIAKMCERVNQLGDMKMDQLRSIYPAVTETQAELVRIMKEEGLTRGRLIADILADEFLDELADSVELEDYTPGRTT